MRLRNSLAFLSAFCVLQASAGPALALSSEASFYRGITGNWEGPGEIVAGKYKGTRFNCSFNGAGANAKTGLDITGSCRVGVFNQPIKASVESSGRGMSGQFLDGEAGEGMDIVGGQFSPSRLTVDVKRKDLRGVMSARLAGANKLNITISVRVEGQLIPVIGMSLDRISSPDNVVASAIIKR